MLTIDSSRCDGCGSCLDACPAGAIRLNGGLAVIDAELCEECQVCRDACPQDAILPMEELAAAIAAVPANAVVLAAADPLPVADPVELSITPAPAHALSDPAQPRPPSLRGQIVPAISSVLRWTGHELIPRLAPLALDWLEQRTRPGQQAAVKRRDTNQNRAMAGQAGRRQQRRRLRRRGR